MPSSFSRRFTAPSTPTMAKRYVAPASPLTARELGVAGLIARGWSNPSYPSGLPGVEMEVVFERLAVHGFEPTADGIRHGNQGSLGNVGEGDPENFRGFLLIHQVQLRPGANQSTRPGGKHEAPQEWQHAPPDISRDPIWLSVSPRADRGDHQQGASAMCCARCIADARTRGCWAAWRGSSTCTFAMEIGSGK